MSLDLKDVRIARKRAYDRVRYQLEKQGLTGGELGSQYALPRIPKDLDPSLYNEWYEMFENIGTAGGNTTAESYVQGEVEIWEEIEETVNRAKSKPDISDEPWYEDYSRDNNDADDIVDNIQEEREDATEPEAEEEYEEPWDGSTDEGWESDDYYDGYDYDYYDDYGYEDVAPNDFDIQREIAERLEDLDYDVGTAGFQAITDIYNSTSLSFQQIHDELKEEGYFTDLEEIARYMASNYYGGLTLLNRTFRQMYAHFGLTFSGFYR